MRRVRHQDIKQRGRGVGVASTRALLTSTLPVRGRLVRADLDRTSGHDSASRAIDRRADAKLRSHPNCHAGPELDPDPRGSDLRATALERFAKT